MNYRRNLGCLAFCLFFVIQASAQYSSDFSQITSSKPILFKQVPQKSQCSITELDRLFSVSGAVNSAISQGFFLRGELIENVNRNSSVQSINIGLSDFAGAIFTLSRTRLEDGSVRYNGHIISADFSDAMVLTLENGKYYFTKTEQRLIITD
jgi:hypothetical protein